jgi:hypothetical protein
MTMLIDINNPVFQESWFKLDKAERTRVIDSLKKLRQMTWEQLYRDTGFKWEKIVSITPPKGIDSVYSIRISQARRATAYRDADMIRFLTVEPNHDATYGKK